MKKRIFFLADDDTDDQEFFIEALKEIDTSIECVVAVNGEDALQKLKNNAGEIPDYIFLGMNMPRMNGRECLLEIKKIKELSDTPVIIYSTTSLKKDIEDTRRLGASFFLTKPASFDMLKQKLYYILSGEWIKQLSKISYL